MDGALNLGEWPDVRSRCPEENEHVYLTILYLRVSWDRLWINSAQIQVAGLLHVSHSASQAGSWWVRGLCSPHGDDKSTRE